MSYDRLAECLHLIEHGPPAVTPEQLSRRTRFVPLAVDVAGDVAAAMFVRRSVSGVPEVEDHALERVSGEWRLLGGSGGSAPDDLLADRPPGAELGGWVLGQGHGSAALAGRAGRHGFRVPIRYLKHGEYRAASEVATVVVLRWRSLAARRARGRQPIWSPGRGWTSAADAERRSVAAAIRRLARGRPIAVPRHGNVVVAWTTRHPPWLVPLDAAGRPLGVQSAAPSWPPGHRPPLRYRARLRHPWLRMLSPRGRRARPGWAPFESAAGKAGGDQQRDEGRDGQP